MQYALKIISIEIDEAESDGEFVNVEDNTEDRKIFRSIGYSDDEIDNFKPYDDESFIDFGFFVWDYPNWFNGEIFYKEDLDD
ncbi:hypothetical protein ABNX05_01680 [Lysinibacillus sp. M3]|uniref:Phage protein n=1 Tax=Lysinibacillus zambalensis TaxID=3160866 RepID=A0ABV1MLC2_9BACI